MYPNRNYALYINVAKADSEQTSKNITNQVPIVKIKPEFPGCLVTPTEVVIELKERVSERFIISPLVQGEISEACINFFQEDKSVLSMSCPTKVVDSMTARLIALIGIIFGIGPTLSEIIFGINVNENFTSAFPVLFNINTLIILEFILFSIMSIIALVIFIKRTPRPRRSSVTYTLSLNTTE
jgi:hypothetical protein